MRRATSTILHCCADNLAPYVDAEALVQNCGLPGYTLVETGSDHQVADQASLEQMI